MNIMNLGTFKICTCLGIYQLDPAPFLTPAGLAWQPALKQTKIKLDLSTDINMLITVEKSNRGGTWHPIYQYVKANNKAQNKESSNLKHVDEDLLYGRAVLQKLPVNGFEWVENTSQFSKDFIKSYNEESD